MTRGRGDRVPRASRTRLGGSCSRRCPRASRNPYGSGLALLWGWGKATPMAATCRKGRNRSIALFCSSSAKTLEALATAARLACWASRSGFTADLRRPATGGWRSAIGDRRLATGSWRRALAPATRARRLALALATCGLQLATGDLRAALATCERQLATGDR